MEFWGTEVPPGKPQVNSPGDETYFHVSQAALGPSTDGKSERVVIRVETGGKNLVLGTLVSGKVDQMTLDLIFDREFILSHTSTSCSVFFCGYKTEKGGDEEYTSGNESDEDDEDDDEDLPVALPLKENGSISAKEGVKASKSGKVTAEAVPIPSKEAAKANARKGGSRERGPIDDEALESDESGEDDEDEIGDGSSSDEASDDEDDEDSDEDEDDMQEDTPVQIGKKRPVNDFERKSNLGVKKARVDTPAKPGLVPAVEKKNRSEKSVPAKLTPLASGRKSETKENLAKTPKGGGKDASGKNLKTSSSPGGESAKKGGAHQCSDCKRNFSTESALSQHATAKHKS